MASIASTSSTFTYLDGESMFRSCHIEQVVLGKPLAHESDD